MNMKLNSRQLLSSIALWTNNNKSVISNNKPLNLEIYKKKNLRLTIFNSIIKELRAAQQMYNSTFENKSNKTQNSFRP